jgi:predicted DNA-binding WGR domain protein
MAEVADIAAFFEEHFANLGAKPDQEMFQPFKRSMMPIQEVKKRATPVNPFLTVKRYKQEGQVTRFWHIYGSPSPATLIVCWGQVGHYEGYEEIKGEHLDALKAKYRHLIDEKTTEGYDDWRNYKEMILQFHTNDGWGGLDDLAFRNQIWDNLNEQLFWSGNGEVSGGDIGSGTVNLFFRAISPDLAVQLINALLEAKQIHRPYLIAIEVDDIAQKGVNVVYPADYTGEFIY